ncbi:MAG: Bax inhibitor-1/YccA family protein [Pseudomonadota bacterium]
MAQNDTARKLYTGATTDTQQIDAGLRAHMNKVYGVMAVGMVITALAAWAISGLATTDTPTAETIVLNNGTMLSALGETLYLSPLRWVLMFAPLIFLFVGWGPLMRRASAEGVKLGFFVFAAVIGISLSSIFIVFTAYSIVQTFLITAITFASLSLWGYTTKRDLSRMGTFLLMGLIGLIVAIVINIFLASPAMMFAISIIGVLVFAGLTAFFTQDIKNTYLQMAGQADQDWLDKAAIDGAMSLYLAFLNLFQFLLMFFGSQE